MRQEVVTGDGEGGVALAMESFVGHGKEFEFYSKWEPLRGFKQQDEGVALAAMWRMGHRAWRQGRPPWR